MDVGRAFGYVFQDDRWLGKLLIGSATFFVPILGWLAFSGYLLRVTRQVAAGADVPLPDWTDWGDLIVGGLKLFGVVIVWELPLIALQVIYQLNAPQPGEAMTNAGAYFALSCILFVLSIGYGVIYPAIVARLATTRSFAASLDVGSVLGAVRSNLGDYLIILLVGVGVGIVFAVVFVCFFVVVLGAAFSSDNLLGTILLSYAVIGAVMLVVGPYLGAVFHHLYGQAYYRATGGPVVPAVAPRV